MTDEMKESSFLTFYRKEKEELILEATKKLLGEFDQNEHLTMDDIIEVAAGLMDDYVDKIIEALNTEFNSESADIADTIAENLIKMDRIIDEEE